MLFVFLRKYAWKSFKIRPYAWKQKILVFFLKGNQFKSCEIFFEFFWKVFRNISEKTKYFNTGFVSYSINIQLDIMQNW